MEELGIKMRFKRCVKAMVVFAIFVIFGWDIINFLGSRYTIGMFDLSVVYLCHRISPEFYFLIYLRLFMGSNPHGPRREKTRFSPMQEQRRRSASQ